MLKYTYLKIVMNSVGINTYYSLTPLAVSAQKLTVLNRLNKLQRKSGPPNVRNILCDFRN